MSTEPEWEPLSRRERIILTIVGGVSLFFVLVCMGLSFFVDTLFYLATGWIPYLKRTLPTLTVSASGLFWFLFCLALFAAGLHLACRGVYRGKRETASAEEDRGWQLRWSFSLVILLLVLVSSGICLIGVSHQFWWMATGEERMLYRGGMTAMRRSTSRNLLKQIGLAMHDYHGEHNQFPSGGTIDSMGQPQHGWAARLLPYLDQQELYQQIDFTQPWTSEENRQPYETSLYVFHNPGLDYDFDLQEESQSDRPGYKPAHYAANQRLLGINSSVRLRDIKDGTSYTILGGEVKAGIRAWGDPLNFRDPARGINQGPGTFGGPYGRGAQVLLSDGSVRHVSENIDPTILKALSTPAGGEENSDDWDQQNR